MKEYKKEYNREEGIKKKVNLNISRTILLQSHI